MKKLVSLAALAAAFAVPSPAAAYLPDGDSGTNVKAGNSCSWDPNTVQYAGDYQTGALLICSPDGTWHVVR